MAERAGVNERTVYRHFGSERGLRDAVLHRNEQEAGIELDGMELEDIATVASQIFDHVAQYPREPRPPLDPTLTAAKERQHESLLAAIDVPAGQRTDGEQTVVAAVFDALWSVATYERLVVDWEIDHDQRRPGDHLGHWTGRAGRAGRTGTGTG